MIPTIRALFEHQAWADAALLGAVRSHPGAAADAELRKTLHHMVLVQRAFLSLFLERPFDLEKEMRPPESLAELEGRFRETHGEELAFAARLEEVDLARVIEMPWIQGSRPTVREALMQVVMHSQNHRGQCALLLRKLAGSAPTMDFILWLKDRPSPEWP